MLNSRNNSGELTEFGTHCSEIVVTITFSRLTPLRIEHLYGRYTQPSCHHICNHVQQRLHFEWFRDGGIDASFHHLFSVVSDGYLSQSIV